jgi:effector-binding domain-containing protein
MYQPEIRSVPQQRVASARGRVRNYKSVAKPMGELCGLVHRHLKAHQVAPAGPDTVIWSADYGTMQEFELQVCVPITADVPSTDRVATQTFDGMESVGVIKHHGSYEQLDEAYAALAAWLDKNGYERIGPLREVYLHYGCSDQTENVTEIHVPVKKI